MSRLFSKQLDGLLYTIFSNNLLKLDKRDIGRKLFKLAWDPFLNAGITLASLNCSVTMPVKNKALRIIC